MTPITAKASDATVSHHMTKAEMWGDLTRNVTDAEIGADSNDIAICMSCQLRNAANLSSNFEKRVLRPLGTNVSIFWAVDGEEMERNRHVT